MNTTTGGGNDFNSLNGSPYTVPAELDPSVELAVAELERFLRRHQRSEPLRVVPFLGQVIRALPALEGAEDDKRTTPCAVGG